jgi:ABC-type multidrug transport system permease subunit
VIAVLMHSRKTTWLISLAVSVPVLTLCGWVTYEVGDLASLTFIFGLLVSGVWTPFWLVIALLVEIFAWRRAAEKRRQRSK